MNMQRLTAALAGLCFLFASSVAVANYCGSIVVGGGAGSCSISAPAEAQAAGLHTQTFCDSFQYTTLSFIDFDTANSLTWNDALWYEGHNALSSYGLNNPGLTLFANSGNGDTYLSTMFHDTSGGQFFTPPFYAEATLNCTDWCSFWFLSVAHARGQSVNGTPSTYSAEIDVIEGDPAAATIHRIARLSWRSNEISIGTW